MNFPKYWARGDSDGFSCWRWSSQNLAEAQALANQAVRELAARIQAGARPTSRGGYYPNRPFREQVLQEFKNSSGEVTSAITRNSYGCQVLNTAQIMFVDIDLPEPKPAGGFFKRLFGKPEPPPPDDRPNAAIAKVENWTRSHPDWGWRIYRTRAGLRLLATQGLVEADSSVTEGIFAEFGADPLYRMLCKTQKCFRARLTPKPWRCGVHSKPERWPFLDAKREERFRKWEATYQSASASWATCALLHQCGNSLIHPEVQGIVKVHDETTRVASQLQLA